MDLDHILHDKKHFAELTDDDIRSFLEHRAFRSEHLSLEFKSEFPARSGARYDIRDICKYIVGFSNEDGGIVVYGVQDSIKDAQVAFTDYLVGLKSHPSLEDLSQWLRERVHPLIASPAIRFFQIDSREIAVLKVPVGVNKPYCYFEPATKAVTYFKKTAGAISELAPAEITEFHRTQILDQSLRILRAFSPSTTHPVEEDGLAKRTKECEEFSLQRLEDPVGYGYIGMYSKANVHIEIPVAELEEFLERHRTDFSETLRYYPDVEAFQTGVSVGYFPRAIRRDIKSTARTTLYNDGFVGDAMQADFYMDGDKILHAGQTAYELQRHLQLVKALVEDRGATTVDLIVDFKNIIGFSLGFDRRHARGPEYPGQHKPIRRHVEVDGVPAFNGPERNIAAAVVKDVMEEVSRVFGYSRAIPGAWTQSGYLTYVKGIENQR